MENEEYIGNLKYLFEEEEIEKLNLPKRNSYTYLYIEDIEDYEYTFFIHDNKQLLELVDNIVNQLKEYAKVISI